MNGNFNNDNNKDNNNLVRSFCELVNYNYRMIPLEDFITAYFECRKHKRNKLNSLKFEVNWEIEIVKLWRDVNKRKYQIGRSICFLVNRPKLREVFAADFRDRIIHHVIMQRLEPLFEKFFIEDTFNCRKGKGVLYGVYKLKDQIKDCSLDYLYDCWVAKFDMQGFFMTINRRLLLNMLLKFINKKYFESDKEDLIYLVKTVLENDCSLNCIQLPDSHWKELPKNKSLFTCGKGFGLPIGNLTSQWFANFFLSPFDIHMKKQYEYYGRYVDDFYVIGTRKEVIKVYEDAKQYLRQYGVILHPNKKYIQPYYRGVKFIGYIIKKDRIYIGNQAIDNIYRAIKYKSGEDLKKSLTSYWGFLKWARSQNIKKKLIKVLKNKIKNKMIK